MNVVIDIETKSWCDLKKCGASVYWQDPTTQIIVLCFKIDDQDKQWWWPGKNPTNAIPTGLERAIVEYGATIEAFNISFEYSGWLYNLNKLYGWPMPRDDQWRDLMATACYYALPAALDKLHRALGGTGKNPDGTRLINTYSCLFNPKAKPVIPAEDWDKWVQYVGDDVDDEYEIGEFLGDLPEAEVEMFLLDQRMNRRGLYLDAPGIKNALAIVDEVNKDLTKKFNDITGFNPGQRDKVLEWLRNRGVDLADYAGDTLEDALDNGILLNGGDFYGSDVAKKIYRSLPQGPARDAITIRLKLNKASTKKLAKMLMQMGDDGRARYQMRYHGAQTGRNTGGGFQPLNLVRSWEDVAPEQLVRDIGSRDPHWLDAVYGDSMEAVAKASRHWIMAPEGRQIYSGDFVSIEAVLLACLAGEEWKVQAFRDKAPMYAMMGARIYKLPDAEWQKGDKYFKAKYPDERQDGKRGELAFGYQGGLNAWLKFDDSGRHSDDTIQEFKKAWREQHPAIASREIGVGLWASLEAAAIEAVRFPGRITGYRQVGYQIPSSRPQWLSMILPNDKRIWYYHPEIRLAMPNWHQPGDYEDCAEGTCDCRARPVLTYMTQKAGKWVRVSTYGGKETEHLCQAASRELLQPAAVEADRAGYSVIMTQYDEVVSETDEGFGSVGQFEEILVAEYQPWRAGWPIRADAWVGKRYRK